MVHTKHLISQVFIILLKNKNVFSTLVALSWKFIASILWDFSGSASMHRNCYKHQWSDICLSNKFHLTKHCSFLSLNPNYASLNIYFSAPKIIYLKKLKLHRRDKNNSTDFVSLSGVEALQHEPPGCILWGILVYPVQAAMSWGHKMVIIGYFYVIN